VVSKLCGIMYICGNTLVKVILYITLEKEFFPTDGLFRRLSTTKIRQKLRLRRISILCLTKLV